MIYPPVDTLPYTCHSWMPVIEGTSRQQGLKDYGYLIPKRFDAPYDSEVIRVDFCGLKLPIPSNYDELLIQRYGKNYMTPDPSYVTGPGVFKVWEGKKATMEEY